MLREILYGIITIWIPIISTILIKYLNKKVDEVQSNIESEKVNKYIDSAISSVESAVLTVQQTYVDSLKQSGNFDRVAQVLAKDKATDICKSLIKQESIDAIQVLYGDFGVWLNAQIEQMVKIQKDN